MVEPAAPQRPSDEITRPCPGHRVVAACDLPTETHARTLVKSGTAGVIDRTPAYFTTGYSIRFTVNGTDIMLHRVNRHEFRIIDEVPTGITPTYPPVARYPQPHRVSAPNPHDDEQRGPAGDLGTA